MRLADRLVGVLEMRTARRRGGLRRIKPVAADDPAAEDALFEPALLHPVQEGVDPGGSNVGVLRQIDPGRELGRGIAPLAPPGLEIMLDRIGRAKIGGKPLQIPVGIKERLDLPALGGGQRSGQRQAPLGPAILGSP